MKFLHFKQSVKDHFISNIKSFQWDKKKGGGDFNNSQLHNLYDGNRIQILFTYPYTSQQNGLSEWMLRNINNMIRSLMFHAHLPPIYWVESLHMVAHLLNILPTTTINNQSPFNVIP